jgi:O-antigen/teichoic acid export membrane protein
VLFGAILQGFALVTLSAAMVGGALGPELVLLVAGDAYVGAGEALPGLLLAAAMSGMFYILLVTAGVQERARGVPISAGIGSAVQVAATWLLIPAAGLGGVGVGAALGRATSLAILYVETRRTISINAVVASATVVAAIALAAGLQLLNVNPGGTLLLRLVIAAGTTLIAAAAALYWLAPRLSRLATETDPTA